MRKRCREQIEELARTVKSYEAEVVALRNEYTKAARRLELDGPCKLKLEYPNLPDDHPHKYGYIDLMSVSACTLVVNFPGSHDGADGTLTVGG